MAGTDFIPDLGAVSNPPPGLFQGSEPFQRGNRFPGERGGVQDMGDRTPPPPPDLGKRPGPGSRVIPGIGGEIVVPALVGPAVVEPAVGQIVRQGVIRGASTGGRAGPVGALVGVLAGILGAGIYYDQQLRRMRQDEIEEEADLELERRVNRRILRDKRLFPEPKLEEIVVTPDTAPQVQTRSDFERLLERPVQTRSDFEELLDLPVNIPPFEPVEPAAPRNPDPRRPTVPVVIPTSDNQPGESPGEEPIPEIDVLPLPRTPFPSSSTAPSPGPAPSPSPAPSTSTRPAPRIAFPNPLLFAFPLPNVRFDTQTRPDIVSTVQPDAPLPQIEATPEPQPLTQTDPLPVSSNLGGGPPRERERCRELQRRRRRRNRCNEGFFREQADGTLEKITWRTRECTTGLEIDPRINTVIDEFQRRINRRGF